MAPKPELIIFNTHIISGIGSFFYNLLSNDPYGQFDVRIIHISNDAWPDAKMAAPFDLGNETIFEIQSSKHESVFEISKRMQALIPDGPGAVVASFNAELSTLHLYPKPNKTVFFVCHDDNHLKVALKFRFKIDVFVAHNPVYAEMMKAAMPDRTSDVYYIPYGIKLPQQIRVAKPAGPLRVVWLARLMEHKGVRRIPGIDSLLKEKGLTVEWTIIGDGPEKAGLVAATESRSNFSFYTPKDFGGVADLLANQDVYILPSRLDGLPVALIEAMSVGCVPVISEFNQGMKLVVREDMGYVLPVGDDNAFAETIAALAADRNLLQRLSNRARELTRAEYDINLQAKKYFDLFGQYKELKRDLPNKFPFYGSFFVSLLIPNRWRGSLKKLIGKK